MNQEKLSMLEERSYNCSQTVLGYFAQAYGLDLDLAARLAKAFESGQMQGGICGAVNGAYMVLGLEYSEDTPENRDLLIEKIQEFNRRFSQAKGSIVCRDLLGGLEVYTKEGMERVLEEDKFTRVCDPAMEEAIQILEAMIGESRI